jgi:hypothetical protein
MMDTFNCFLDLTYPLARPLSGVRISAHPAVQSQDRWYRPRNKLLTQITIVFIWDFSILSAKYFSALQRFFKELASISTFRNKTLHSARSPNAYCTSRLPKYTTALRTISKSNYSTSQPPKYNFAELSLFFFSLTTTRIRTSPVTYVCRTTFLSPLIYQNPSRYVTLETTGGWDGDSIYYKKNSMVWVSKRTIPNEQPPLVGEVIANFCG